jgi:hypothetical protein
LAPLGDLPARPFSWANALSRVAGNRVNYIRSIHLSLPITDRRLESSLPKIRSNMSSVIPDDE